MMGKGEPLVTEPATDFRGDDASVASVWSLAVTSTLCTAAGVWVLVLKLISETSLSCWGQAESPGPDIAFLVTRLLLFLRSFVLKATALVVTNCRQWQHSVCAMALKLCASRPELMHYLGTAFPLSCLFAFPCTRACA